MDTAAAGVAALLRRAAYRASTYCAMALAVTAVAATEASAKKSPLLPDLVPDNPENLRLDAVTPAGGFPQLLLKFDAFIHNAGPGLLEVRGSSPEIASGEPEMTRVVQRLYYGTTRDAKYTDLELDPGPRLQFQSEWGHDHFHFFDPVTYYLVGTGESASYLAFDKASVGFCFVDSERIEAPDTAPPLFHRSENRYCEEGNRDAQEVFMGLSPGWRDVYHSGLPLQHIDVSNARPGRYRIATVIDPSHHLFESNESNNRSTPEGEPAITIPGYVARSQVHSVAAGLPVRFKLDAERFGTGLPGYEQPGPPEFLVVDGPAHGELMRLPPDQGWNDGEYLYVPDSGFAGDDSLVFATRDSLHPDFPYQPSRATIRFLVGSPLAPITTGRAAPSTQGGGK